MNSSESVSADRLVVAGVETHVLDAGTGSEAVVCVHGNPDSGDLWEPLLARASELGRVVAPDLPGLAVPSVPTASPWTSTFSIVG